MKIGDKVEVLDPGLAMLRALLPDQPPNNVGWVHEIQGDDILVAFPIDSENDSVHYQVALYSRYMVKAREEDADDSR